MDPATTLLIALGLSMDAFAVSVSGGVCAADNRAGNAFRMAAFFGVFQSVMPVIGWLAAVGFRDVISGMDHWAAFVILAAIGSKMIYESLVKRGESRTIDPKNYRTLLLLALATSIDALAVGVGYGFLAETIMLPVLVIGAVTFAVSFAGYFIGCGTGNFFEKKSETAGGVILIAIGLKILAEHTLFQ